MKLQIAFLALVCLTLAAVPAIAQTEIPVYDNGPVNGQVDAWTINSGFAVSNTFQIPNGGIPLLGLSFWAWVEPGDTATNVEVAIGSTGYFSNNLFDSTVTLNQSNCFTNNFGFDVCQESASFNAMLNGGNYYLTLENATTSEGAPLYWDENSGVGCQSQGCPSSAQENAFGTIPSEAFTVIGYMETGTAPEPGSIILFGAGLLAVAGRLRSKLF